MENSNIIISHNDVNNITKDDLVSMLILLGKGYLFDNVVISKTYLIEIIKVALKNT